MGEALTVAMCTLLVLLAVGVNVGISLGIAAIIGTTLFSGSLAVGLGLPLLQGVSVTTTYGFIVIPLFVLLASLASEAQVTTGLFNAAYRWTGRRPGGVGIGTIATCAGMAALTGSSAATAAAMARIALPELRKFGYDERLSVGAVTVGGTLAIMIPPSITFVLYSIFAEESIGKLLMAGVIPGLMLALLFALSIWIRCRLNPSLAPRSPAFSWQEKVNSLLGIIPFICVIVGILLGILTGFWTPVEAAAVGVVAVFIIGLVTGKFTREAVLKALTDSVITSASIMIVVIGCMMFSTFLALSGFSEYVTNWVIGLGWSPILLFLVLMAMYIVLGMFLEATSILALTVPLVMPIVEAVGWDPIWFGVILVLMMEVAAITPPVGLNLYAVKATVPELTIETIWSGSVPYIICCFIGLVILYFLPIIALYLPSMM